MIYKIILHKFGVYSINKTDVDKDIEKISRIYDRCEDTSKQELNNKKAKRT
ncbi:hypothetical protein [Caldisalinibacter kiritimatiensis]|uniref:Uncharacterized protein n=1 Tax=Caldisalinibacter kiritimatiensis TaxID=1304284 RepID=R1CTC0_9FIRM|nr:hypothetical protein [Caldisalinibacter kiritimatiensis]EOC99933.1 hypothetical protein L21TH_2044 [Caldisalinibacter kiritimatiensis]